jgi:D-glycero-D-manno-heptose 1,7-bisphosphate phosphatase
MVNAVAEPLAPRPAVFLDRDGVIVVPEFRDGRSYAPTTIEAFRLYDSAADELGRLKDARYLLVVVTNQPDVARGIIAPATLEAMHRRLAAELPIDMIRTCIHDGKDGCACRKPKPGMLLAAAELLNIDFGTSYMVGDRGSDIEAGHMVGCRTIFIDLGSNETKPARPTFGVRSLAEAVDAILNSAVREG